MNAGRVGAGGLGALKYPRLSALVAPTWEAGFEEKSFTEELPPRVIK